MFKSNKTKSYNLTSLNDVLEIIPSLDVDLHRKTELKELYDHFEGNQNALSEKYFPAPSSETADQYDKNKKALIYINRVKLLVRTWLAIVAGDVSVNITKAPNKKEVESFVKDYSYKDKVSTWKQNAILFGTAVAVPIYKENELDIWLPFPISTVIITNPVDVEDVLLVAEINGNYTQFISKWGEGIIYENGEAAVVQRNYSKLPVAIGYGYSKLHERKIYGESMAKAAIDFSIAETNTAFNISLLGRQQTRDILSITGPLEEILSHLDNPDLEVGLNEQGTLLLPDGFETKFLKPNPGIPSAISIQKNYASLFSSVSGLPMDLVSPDQVNNPSNESAKIRSSALLHEAKQVVPRWLHYENNLILSLIFMVEYHNSNEYGIGFREIKQKSSIDIKNNYQLLPKNENEITQNTIAKVAAGLMSLESALLELNNNMTEKEVKQLVKDYEKKLKVNLGNPNKIAQQALQTSVEALTDEQRLEKENKSN